MVKNWPSKGTWMVYSQPTQPDLGLLRGLHGCLNLVDACWWIDALQSAKRLEVLLLVGPAAEPKAGAQTDTVPNL